MILTLARRFAFSPVSGHRSSSIRIIFSLMFSMAVLMTAIGVMDYLQRGRFEGIRGAISFDITVEGDETAKMRTRYPHADIFLYGETEVLADGNPYILRYIDDDYHGDLIMVNGDRRALLVPYSIYASKGFSDMTIVSLEKKESGRTIPSSQEYDISGSYLLSGTSASMLFLPLSESNPDTPLFTAIKGVDGKEASVLRSDGFSAISWSEKEDSLYSAFMIERTMMIVILSFLFIVILVSLKSSISVLVRDKEREMHEAVVLGMRRGEVFLVVLFSSWLVITIALIGGFALSIVILRLASSYFTRFYFLESEIAMHYGLFFVFSLILFLFSLLFSLLSMRKTWEKDAMEVLCG